MIRPNRSPILTPTAQFTSTVVSEVDAAFLSGYTTTSNFYDSDPYAWIWQEMLNQEVWTYDIDLPHPVSGGTAMLEVEVFSYNPSRNVNDTIYQARMEFNGVSLESGSWRGKRHYDIIDSLPSDALMNGTNTLLMQPLSVNAYDLSLVDNRSMHFNRLVMTYPRQLVADNNELIFNLQQGGYQVQIEGVTAANAFVWDISDPTRPVQIDAERRGSQVSFGRSSAIDLQFIVTTPDNVRQPVAISQYTPVNIVPDGGSAWVAISHANFITETERLAQHRGTL